MCILLMTIKNVVLIKYKNIILGFKFQHKWNINV